jgi:glycosyltransferase involved in cell wall biosynthesis
LRTKRRLRVAMLGLRSLHGGHGGVETHIQQLAPELIQDGDVDLLVVERAGYATPQTSSEPANLKRVTLYAPKSKHFEALVHSVLGVVAAAFWRPDILHIHAVGPALVTPLARILGMRVVVTHHGEDYNREKWGGIAKTTIRFGEKMAGAFANGLISVSGVVAERLRAQYPRQRIEHLPNGVRTQQFSGTGRPDAVPPHFRYILNVARIVPEKRQLDLIRAFEQLRHDYSDWALVLVGAAPDRSAYESEILAAASLPGSRIYCLGHQTGANLAAAFTGADLFVLPSSHEGNPIALLEAMAASLPVIASDIIPNLEIALPAASYYRLGDIEGLGRVLKEAMEDAPGRRVDWSSSLSQYSWEHIGQRTRAFYEVIRG